MKKLNSKGSSPLHIVLILVIVGLIAGVGYYVYNSQKETNTVLQPKSQNSNAETDETGQKSFEEYLSSLEPIQKDIDELYYGNQSQFEYEKEEVFGSCVQEWQKESYSVEDSNSLCICTLEKETELHGGIVKYTNISRVRGTESMQESITNCKAKSST